MPGPKISATPACSQRRHVVVGDDPAHGHEHVVHPALGEELGHPRHERHVGARQDRQADDVDVLLERGRGDHLGRLSQARVDDLEPLVTQAPGEDLGTAIMAVEPGLRDQHLERSVGHGADRSARRCIDIVKPCGRAAQRADQRGGCVGWSERPGIGDELGERPGRWRREVDAVEVLDLRLEPRRELVGALGEPAERADRILTLEGHDDEVTHRGRLEECPLANAHRPARCLELRLPGARQLTDERPPRGRLAGQDRERDREEGHLFTPMAWPPVVRDSTTGKPEQYASGCYARPAAP